MARTPTWPDARTCPTYARVSDLDWLPESRCRTTFRIQPPPKHLTARLTPAGRPELVVPVMNGRFSSTECRQCPLGQPVRLRSSGTDAISDENGAEACHGSKPGTWRQGYCLCPQVPTTHPSCSRGSHPGPRPSRVGKLVVAGHPAIGEQTGLQSLSCLLAYQGNRPNPDAAAVFAQWFFWHWSKIQIDPSHPLSSSGPMAAGVQGSADGGRCFHQSWIARPRLRR